MKLSDKLCLSNGGRILNVEYLSVMRRGGT